nr:MAG TPA: hypothetical protein [Bacteriophage sp.]
MYTPPYQIMLKISDGQKIFSQLFLNFMRVLFRFLNRIETLQRGKVRHNPNRDQPHDERTPPTVFIICHCRRASFCLLLCVSLLIDLHVHTFKKP